MRISTRLEIGLIFSLLRSAFQHNARVIQICTATIIICPEQKKSLNMRLKRGIQWVEVISEGAFFKFPIYHSNLAVHLWQLANSHTALDAQLVLLQGGFICTFSLSIALSITLQTSKFRNQFTISSNYFDMACYLKRETYSGPISFEVQRNDI